MPFQPNPGDPLVIDGTAFIVAEHPVALGMPYGQEGRIAVVYQLKAGDERRALKVFRPRYRDPGATQLSSVLARLADMAGLAVCRRIVLTPEHHGALLRQHPDLTYAVLMPWMEGPTWLERVMQGKSDDNAPPPLTCLEVARALCGVLAVMEQRGLAHCDLSGPNIILTRGGEGRPIQPELIDVEQMYGAEFVRPRTLPAGSPGYARHSGAETIWEPAGDRFAGAIIIAEMLCICDPRFNASSWGESFFDPANMSGKSDQYLILNAILEERWGHSVAGLFNRVWTSDSLQVCPTFGEWLVSLPETAPAVESPPLRSTFAVDATIAAERQVRVLQGDAKRLEATGNLQSAALRYEEALRIADAAGPALAMVAVEIGDAARRLKMQRQGPPEASPPVKAGGTSADKQTVTRGPVEVGRKTTFVPFVALGLLLLAVAAVVGLLVYSQWHGSTADVTTVGDPRVPTSTTGLVLTAPDTPADPRPPTALPPVTDSRSGEVSSGRASRIELELPANRKVTLTVKEQDTCTNDVGFLVKRANGLTIANSEWKDRCTSAVSFSTESAADVSVEIVADSGSGIPFELTYSYSAR